MKKTLHILSAAVFLTLTAHAQFGNSAHTLSVLPVNSGTKTATVSPLTSSATAKTISHQASTTQRSANPSVQFSNDVIIKTDTTNQRNVKIATAFNGWIYAASSINTTGGGGIQVRQSKDGGLTWTDFVAGTIYNGIDYPSIDIKVAGNDTSNLFIFLAGINHNTSLNTFVAWVDKYDAHGNFIGENFNESSGANTMYDIAIATDYTHPCYLSSPFSIAVLYSKYGSTLDSVIYASSLNAGTSYTTREGIYGTSHYCGKVAIAFGISGTYSNGRYFAAFESKNGQADNVGHVVFTHTTNDPTSAFQAPIFIDSINAGFTGRIGHPRIACINDGIDNDSSNITTVIAVDRAWSSTDYDAIAMISKMSVYSAMQNWRGDAISSGNDYETGTDVVFNDSLRSFDATYYDSTTFTLQAVYNDVNIPTANSWTNFSSQYNDVTTNLVQPFPRLSLNRKLGSENFAWNSEGSLGHGVSLFDAEINPTGIPVAHSTYNFASPYPNPSNGAINFHYNLNSNQHVQVTVINLLGQEISNIDLGTQSAGDYVLPVDFSSAPNGIYIYRFTIGTEIKTGNLVIAH